MRCWVECMKFDLVVKYSAKLASTGDIMYVTKSMDETHLSRTIICTCLVTYETQLSHYLYSDVWCNLLEKGCPPLSCWHIFWQRYLDEGSPVCFMVAYMQMLLFHCVIIHFYLFHNAMCECVVPIWKTYDGSRQCMNTTNTPPAGATQGRMSGFT